MAHTAPVLRRLDTPFTADSTLEYVDPPGRRRLRQAVSLLALATFAGYLLYRGLYTLNPEAPVFSTVVYLAEVHGFFALALYYHQCWALRRRRVPEPPRNLSVDVFITTYNEDVDLLRQTVRAAIAMRYPHQTFVLDDGRRPDVRRLCDELGAQYLTRDTNTDAKAGNWNHAFARTKADFIATFDADHVPRPNFLERTLGFFADPDVALVQVPQAYHNLDSVQHRVDWETRRMYAEQDVFFNLVMPGKDHYNAAFFCGTGAVLRREALEPHGGIITGTITEDLHTSVVLHSEGWKSVYVNEVLVTGLAPMDFRSFDVQRLRWAEGNLRTVAHINPVTARGLTLQQRISYMASLYHWTTGLPKLVYYLAPPWMLLTHTFPIAHFDARFVAIYLTFMTTLLASYKFVSRGTGRLLMDEVFNMASFFTMLRALKRAVLGRRKPSVFVVTDKKGTGQSYTEVLPHFVLLGFSILALGWSWMGLGFGVSEDWFGAGVASFWTVYNMALVGTVLQIALRPAQKRQTVRFRAGFPVEIAGAGQTVGMTADISEGGCTLLWPSALRAGEPLSVTLHLGREQMPLQGRVVASYGRRGAHWVAHGVRFDGLSQAQIDHINDAFFTLVVPTLFSSLSQPSWARRTWALVQAALRGTRRKPRRQLALPVRVSVLGQQWIATTRDVSLGGLSLTLPAEVPVGTVLDVTVLSGEPWTRRLVITRCQSVASEGPFPAWLCGARFDRRAEPREVDTLLEWMAA